MSRNVQSGNPTRNARLCARKRKGRRSKARRLALWLAAGIALLLALWSGVSVWYVHHPREWLAEKAQTLPAFVVSPLLMLGNPLGDMTDAMDLTGEDAVYEYDEPAPFGSIVFAGLPVRRKNPAPDDIQVLNRGEFTIGWSPRLRHAVWCAYHVPREAKFEIGKRPSFIRDRAAARCGNSSDYANSGYDRGHLAPNYAIASRFGNDAQRTTFLLSNIAPQSPALNRGVWRDVEHRISELWTARWGEIWVIVGCIPGNGETLSGTDIDVPSKFFQVVVAQEGLDIRALALVFDQDVSWSEWPTRHLVSIDELEELTGLDFLPELPSFIQDPLESQRPTRLWPIRKLDIFKHIANRLR